MSEGRVSSTLRRIGPRPGLLARYSLHRATSAWRRRRLRETYASSVAAVPGGARLAPLGPALGSAPELPAPLREAAEAIRLEAERVLQNRLTILGRDLELGPKPSWHVDPISGHRWPTTFYQDVEVTRLDDDSDAKLPWELSRGHQFLTLARAAALFGEERYARELERQLADWLDANPTGQGINWANPMEVAIRAVNWVWALGTLERSGIAVDDRLRQRATASLQAHGRHLAANPEGTPLLRSNHYLADLLGLLVLGCCVEGDPAAPSWARRARRELERQVLAQVLPDGLDFEASLPYHGLALEMLILARHVARVRGRPLSARFDDRLALMLEASRAIRFPDGRIPQFGDCDSGRILPAGPARPPSHDHLLWLGAAELGSGRPLTGTASEEVAWTFGPEAWHAIGAAQERPPPTRTRFEPGGVFLLRGGGTSVAVRCGDVGQNGNGGHAHNDLLSYELFRAEPLVVDSGTFVYTADPDCRNAMRSTAAHNTVAVDGEEINPIDPQQLFRLRQVATPTVHEFETAAASARLTASHDGYLRLPCAALHRRRFELDRRTGELSITDTVEAAGPCKCASHVHLAPGWQVAAASPGEAVVERGGKRFALRFHGVSTVETREGWVSNAYGQRERAAVLVARVAAKPAARFGYRFDFQAV